MTRNLLEPHILKRMPGSIEISEGLSDLLKGGYILMSYVVNDNKITLKGADIAPGSKVFDVMIRVNKTFSMQAFQSIMNFFVKRDDLKIQQTTGFCLPPPKPERKSMAGKQTVARTDTCLWEALVESPPDLDVEQLKRDIMQINIEYEEKVISSSEIKEVPIENDGRR